MRNFQVVKIIATITAVILITAIFCWLATNKSAPSSSLSLPIPFTTQAPNGNWVGNENCEEASSVMANAYLNGDTENILPAVRVDQEIQNIIKLEQANLGHNANTGTDQTAQIIQSVYHLRTKSIQNYLSDDLKKALANHHPVLLMIDANKLGNPTYQANGRLYHVIVVRGYDGQNFIVNDPGTEKGENARYSFAVLNAAAADWDQGQHKLEPNKKIALEVFK